MVKSLPPGPPRQLKAYELDLGDHRFVLFEWDEPRVLAIEAAAGLTGAQRAVLGLLLEGKSTKEIAVDRGCSERTVANQIASIFLEFGVHSRCELAAHFAGAKETSDS